MSEDLGHRRSTDGTKGTIQNIGLIIAAFTSGNFNAILNGDIDVSALLTPTTLYVLAGYLALRYSPRIGELPDALASGWRKIRIAARTAFGPLPPVSLFLFALAAYLLLGNAS